MIRHIDFLQELIDDVKRDGVTRIAYHEGFVGLPVLTKVSKNSNGGIDVNQRVSPEVAKKITS